MKRAAISILLACALALSGCSPKVMLRPVALPVPAEPALAPVKAAQVQCLDAVTYTTIVDRENALRHWALELRAVIEANNKASSQASQK